MNSSENWDLHIDPDVLKALKRISRREAEGLLVVIRLLPSDPYFGDIKKMRGEEDAWRRLVGAYRVFYKIKVAERKLLVFRIERRTSHTY